jgi:hypothetical protein
VPNDAVIDPVAYLPQPVRNLSQDIVGDTRQYFGQALLQGFHVALMSSP